MRITTLTILSLMFLTVGCGQVTRSYTVSVKNNTKDILTIGFLHDGESDEQVWQSPGELALDPRVKPEVYSWGRLLAPGKTATTKGPITGHMDSNANAYLRVYRGDIPLSQILSIGQNSPDRAEVDLYEGENQITVVDRDGKLVGLQNR